MKSAKCRTFFLIAWSAAAASAFSSPLALSRRRGRSVPSSRLFAEEDGASCSRGAFLSAARRCAVLSSSTLLGPSAARAEDAPPETAKPSRSIQGCAKDADDCISSANIKDARGSYSPPWTFEVSPDEAFARIKGVIKSDEAFAISELDEEGRYLRASIRRFAGEDEVEFLVKGDDKVVLFKSTARKNGSVSDFGANGKRIDDIRRKGAVFDLMGGGMTADSFQGGGAMTKGNNPLGQIKAFYGLQGGQGLESGTRVPAFDDDN